MAAEIQEHADCSCIVESTGSWRPIRILGKRRCLSGSANGCGETAAKTDGLYNALGKTHLEKSDLGTRRSRSAQDVNTQKPFCGAFTANADAGSLETGNEGINFRSGSGIDEEVIDIDDNDHGFANKETGIEFGGQKTLSTQMIGQVIKEVSRGLA
jgi:hypothetical protein